jgi:excisionase family DNA binding protein
MAKKTPARPTLLTLQRASEETGIPRRTLADLVVRHALAAVRIEGVRRIWVRRDDLERLIESSAS